MQIQKLLRCALLLASVGLVAGCQTLDRGAAQTISVFSFPTGADVKHQGEVVGQTPTEVALERKLTHQLSIEKDGYRPAFVSITPQRNKAGQHLIKFGLAEQTGLYYDLEPNPVQVQLVPEILPASPAADSFSEMTALIVEVDRKREAGEVDPVEHKYIVNRILEFYSQ